MNANRILGKLYASYEILKGKVQPSFSQAGEDQVMRYLINDCLKIADPDYVDIGTHHPVHGNNTFYFYSRGHRGVCIEPDPRYASLIRRHRKKDIFLQAAVGLGEKSSCEFFIFPPGFAGWNTMAEEEAVSRQEQTGVRFERIRIQSVSINKVFGDYFKKSPVIMSIDVEGLDLAILQSIDFSRYQPTVVCAESITFSTTNEQEKIADMTDFMVSNGYFVFADTYVNTIYCRADAFKPITK